MTDSTTAPATASLTDEERLDVVRRIAPYLESWAAFQLEHRGGTGLQLAVAYRGEVLVDAAFGLADVTTEAPLTTEHLFRIASHSKTMTAVAIMQLVEQHELRLDDTVGELIPELATAEAGAVTVRELLGHQAGIIRDSSDGDFWQRGHDFPDRDRLLEIVASEGVVFEPNDTFKYSNIGYSILGLIIERVTCRTYDAATRSAIVEPLGLTRTGSELRHDRADEYAAGHTGRIAHGDARRVIPHVDTRAMAAATGWYSTAREMTTYGRAHVHGVDTLLADASKRLMQREESRVEVRGTHKATYGLGLDVQRIGDRAVVGHSGGYPGHITRTWIDPHDDLVVSALTNDIDGAAGPIATGIVQLIDIALAAATEHRTVPEHLRFDGRFAALWGLVDVVDLGGILHLVHVRAPEPAEATARLVVDDDRLIVEPVPGFAESGEPIVVERDDAGVITSVRLGAMTSWPLDAYRAALAEPQPGERLGRLSL